MTGDRTRWPICPDCLAHHEGGTSCPDEPPADRERDQLDRENRERAALDLPALNAAITAALERWHDPGVSPDPAGMLAAVREAIDPTLLGLRDRAEEAEAAVERVRRLQELTIAASCRVHAIEQAKDTLRVLEPPKETP